MNLLSRSEKGSEVRVLNSDSISGLSSVGVNPLLGLLRLLFQFEWELPVLEHNAWLAKSWNSVGTSLWLLSLEMSFWLASQRLALE